jgi:hypothetical protein
LTTSLRATASLVLLNVSLGDEAELVNRSCGRPFEKTGLVHAHARRQQLRKAQRRRE